MAGILRLKETEKPPPQIIDGIVMSGQFSAAEKARLLGGHRLISELAKDNAGAKLFANAEAGQRIYVIIHDEDPARKYANVYQKINALGSGKFSAKQLQDAIVWDARLSAQQKAAYLGELRKKSAQLKKELTDAYRGQNAFLAGMKNGEKNAAGPAGEDEQPEEKSAGARKNTQTVQALLKLPEVAGYAVLAKEQGRSQGWIERKLAAHLDEIVQDAERYWSYRGKLFEFCGLKMWGPSLNVSKNALTGEISANYICSENQGIPVILLHSIVGKECAWDPKASGTTGGMSNGTGPFQLTGGTVGDVSERLDIVNSKLSSWGYPPIGNDVGMAPTKKGEWEPLVLVQTTSPVGKGRKRRPGHVLVEPQKLGRARRPDEPLTRNLAPFKREMTNYAKALRMATAVLILKGARPDMTTEEMRGVGERYNANSRPARTPEGKVEPIKKRYGKEIKARAEWTERRP